MLGGTYHYELVRTGDLLFGLNPTPGAANLTECVVRVEAPIEELREVSVGESVGYGAQYIARDRTHIAVVRIGYAHGYPRIVRGTRFAIAAGFAVPVLGQVAMEHTVLDVTRIPPHRLKIGSIVELLGPHITAEHIAKTSSTVATDVLVRLVRSVERRYAFVTPTTHHRSSAIPYAAPAI